MRALSELFTTDVGLLSVATIGFILVMAGYFLHYFLKHMREDAERQRLGK